MALEVASYVSQLDPNWPLGTDKQDRGDDHLRLIKDVLKKTLAGPNGTGWEKPVTASPDQINSFNERLTALESAINNVYKVNDIMIRIDNVNPATLIPGTTWTRIDGDFALFLGNGSNAGTTTGNSYPGVPLPQHNHAASFSGDPLPPHNHGSNIFGGAGGGANTNAATWSGYTTNIATTANGAGTPTGTVSVGYSGVGNPTIDVRGARIFLNIWKRVS